MVFWFSDVNKAIWVLRAKIVNKQKNIAVPLIVYVAFGVASVLHYIVNEEQHKNIRSRFFLSFLSILIKCSL